MTIRMCPACEEYAMPGEWLALENERNDLVELLGEIIDKKGRKWHPTDPLLKKSLAVLGVLGGNHGKQ